ncbi:MAG: methyltransferase [Roseiflexaceae bacterium]|nr:methyltransferase [Roseiflexaceae bacterium]
MNKISELPYYQTRELRGTIAGHALRVVTKPGFAGWEAIGAPTELLAEAVVSPPDARVAIFGCGHGALGAVLSRIVPRGRIVLLDPSAIALAMAEQTLVANGARNASVLDSISLLPEQANSFDLVLIDLPQSRQLARRWLAEAHTLLQVGGQLLLAGPNDQGIQSVIDDAAALFGNAGLVAYRKHCRVARAIRLEAPPDPPPWAQEPGIAPGTWHDIHLDLVGQSVVLASLPGVFAYDRLDDGTALLLAHMPNANGLRVLDAGCGNGIIGIAAALQGAAQIDMVDSDMLAIAAAHENSARYHVSGEVLAGDALQLVASRRYDLIVSNPPFHAGKQVSYAASEVFIRHGRTLLKRGGRQVLVANRFIRYDRLLGEVFGQVETLADDRRYHVLIGRD